MREILFRGKSDKGEWVQDTLETTKEIIDSLKLNKKREEI